MAACIFSFPFNEPRIKGTSSSPSSPWQFFEEDQFRLLIGEKRGGGGGEVHLPPQYIFFSPRPCFGNLMAHPLQLW